MKKTTLTLLLIACFTGIYAQLNLQFVSHITYPDRGNDIWAYVAPDGTEYALMGLKNGVSIVSLADPVNPVEVAFIDGEQSGWRDLKTWGHFAYVTADQSGTREGLLVIDLSDLPNSVSSYNWAPVLPGDPDTLFTCHNLYIDEFGYLYLSGCSRVNEGGAIIIDVFSEPGVPKFVGMGNPVYSHDVYVRNNILYTSEIYVGQFGIYDVSDKLNPILKATQTTPAQFNHNTWLSDDGKTLFTTDERSDAPTAAFDISDFNNIRKLDEFRPPNSLGQGVIPHNVHVINDFLIISHYSDGCVIVDASRPENLVQVGNYDTSPEFDTWFHGDWGAYPWLPSGLILASDIETGLWILQPDYKRACWLEGQVINSETGMPVQDVSVKIISNAPNEGKTDLIGNYKSGQVAPGTFEVLFTAKGYFDTHAQAVLVNGQVTILDVEMIPFPEYTIQGRVENKFNDEPIPNAIVFIENQDFTYTTETDANGNFTLPNVLLGEYFIYVGKWGWENGYIENKPLNADETLVFKLAPAYQDNFNLDLGWTVSGDAEDGIWERGKPKGVLPNIPDYDSPNDLGNHTYVTGNGGFANNDDDVDNGATILTSPVMQLRSRYNRPIVSYDSWFFTQDGAVPANDSLTVIVSNGKTSVILEIIDSSHHWVSSPKFDIADYIEITDEMRIIFRVADQKETGHIVETNVDNFSVTEGFTNDDFHQIDDLVKLRFYPNPFRDYFTIDYKVEKSYNDLNLIIFNALGQKVEEHKLTNPIGTIKLTPDFVPGIYFIVFRLDDRLSEPVKMVRQ